MSPSKVVRPTGSAPAAEVVVQLHGENFITTQRLSASFEDGVDAFVQQLLQSGTPDSPAPFPDPLAAAALRRLW